MLNRSHTLEGIMLPRAHFLNSLRIEKLRVNRSRAALSIALFLFNEEKKDGNSILHFLHSLHDNTRETDIKGWVDHDVIGLILPDTDEKGTKLCLEKITHGNGNGHYSVITGTYPSDLFQKLLDEENSRPYLFPLGLDEAEVPRGLQLFLKRAMDIVGSLAGLLLLSPLIILTAIVIKATSPGPAIFKQSRLGLKGTRFPFYKFRSMRWNADDRIHREYVTKLIKGENEEINQGNEAEPLYKIKDDPRITFVGKLIRKTSIDELPQFVNVLKGEMSLVGPRPPIPYEIERYEPWHLRRILEVKPGITGLWQVEGRSKTSFDDMVRLDLRYALNWSLWLDLKILVKTVKAVLRPNGAL
jgi:lipopolysaccharide/colanic/teichoic acid biosynthesis glycosyltransferase